MASSVRAASLRAFGGTMYPGSRPTLDDIVSLGRVGHNQEANLPQRAERRHHSLSLAERIEADIKADPVHFSAPTSPSSYGVNPAKTRQFSIFVIIARLVMSVFWLAVFVSLASIVLTIWPLNGKGDQGKSAAAVATTPTPKRVSSVPSLGYSQFSSYAVAPNQPRLLTVPAIGLVAKVVTVGVDEDSLPQVPKGVGDVGWYNASALPGQKGMSVMSGRCGSQSAKGPFRKLAMLQPGDTVAVERGDTTSARYVVKSSTVIKKDSIDGATLLARRDAMPTGLALVTCAGSYSASTNDTDSRLVIYAARN